MGARRFSKSRGGMTPNPKGGASRLASCGMTYRDANLPVLFEIYDANQGVTPGVTYDALCSYPVGMSRAPRHLVEVGVKGSSAAPSTRTSQGASVVRGLSECPPPRCFVRHLRTRDV